MSEHFLRKVKTSIKKYQMLAPEDTVLVGVSGGPDSIALLHVLNLLRTEYRLSLFVVHVNHMFRGEEAKREAQFVADLAQNWGLGCSVLEKDIPKLIIDKGLSPQEAGHLVRKQVFQEIASEIGATKLALGHHADDRAETVLLHLIQGTGPEGLAGMPPKSGWLIRPLAETYKQEIINYCESNGLIYCLDPSNKKPVYLRNKIRLNLIPYLRTDFNPQIVESLLRLEDIVIEENRLLEEIVNNKFKSVLTLEEKGNITLSRDKLLNEPLAIQRRIIRQAYNLLRPEGQGLSFVHVEQVLDLCKAQEGAKKLNLPRGVIFNLSYDRMQFYDLEFKCLACADDFNYSWEIPGTIRLPEGKFLKASYHNQKPAVGKNFYQVNLDGDRITSPLTVRQRKPGDRLRPLGLDGTKKLKDLFIDRKIPKDERNHIPVVCFKDEIIWLPGITINENYKVTFSTKCYLKLELVENELV
ncbi:MAG: tRNA lysidine(34) synthetase TilS [Peptococcales bacterium]|jgi:tRNA(Ile)-lysidine synthase